MTRFDHMRALAKVPSNPRTEHDVAVYVRQILTTALSNDYQVHQGANLLYRIEIDGTGKISNDGEGAPRRGQYAFQTDILVSKAEIPLVVIELKSGSFSTHDVITYSFKAQRHKQIYPYLRYGFTVVGVEALGRRFLIHNEGFDFAVAVSDRDKVEAALVPVVRRQIMSAERIIELTRYSRIRLRRFEQNIEIDT